MKKILIVDNHIDPPFGSAEIRGRLAEASAAFGDIAISSRRGPDSELPASPKGIDGVVISGSKTRIGENAPWINAQMEFVRALYREKIPTFGICYGEQLIARTLGGDEYAGAAKTGELGWGEIECLPEAKQSVFFKKLPERFYSFQSHNDEVYKLPKNFRLAARSKACAVQAFDVLDAPMWGVQFHPERPLEAGNASLDRRMKQEPNGKILNREIAEKVFSAEIGQTLFTAFLEAVWKRSV